MTKWDSEPWRDSTRNLFSYINAELCREREMEKLIAFSQMKMPHYLG